MPGQRPPAAATIVNNNDNNTPPSMSTPPPPPPPPSPPLPQGWTAEKDTAGRVYYANRSLGRTQWDRPTSDGTNWTDEDLVALTPRSRPVDPTTAQLVGRGPALVFFNSHMRTTPVVDKGEFTVFVACGHVRAGKTRLGEELGKHLTDSAIYVQVELGNGHGYRANFDGRNKDNHEERLGGRLVRAYFDTSELKPISSTKVLNKIFELNPTKNSVVVHFDEHGQYVHAASDDKTNVGPEGSKKLLTDLFNVLSAYERDQQKVVYPVASGITFDDISVDHGSHYDTQRLPLASLNLVQSLTLAHDRLTKKCNDDNKVEQIMGDTLFKVAIADSGGLPGAVIWAADRALQPMTISQGSYIQELVGRAKGYAKFPEPQRWRQCILCSLTHPPLRLTSVLVPRQAEDDTSKDWTVTQASESGSVLVEAKEGDYQEIRVAPCFLAASSSTHELPLNTSILLANLTLADAWIWQRFEQAHVHYYAAVLHALSETRRFWSQARQEILVSDVFRGAQSGICEALDWIVKPQENFNHWTVWYDEQQSIPRSNSSNSHSVDIEDVQHVHVSKTGTPIIDAHFNLNVERVANEGEQGLTVFLQYKHSVKLDATDMVKVSTMNEAVIKLEERLRRSGWPMSRQWVFLWVTNRKVDMDAAVGPHEKLLWVGREELCEHAPLIGMRGLVAVEDDRTDDDQTDE